MRLVFVMVLIWLSSCTTSRLVTEFDYAYTCTINELADEDLFISSDTLTYNVTFVELNYNRERLNYNRERAVRLLNEAYDGAPIKFEDDKQESVLVFENLTTEVIYYNSILESFNQLNNITIIVIPNDVLLDIENLSGDVKGVAGDIPEYHRPEKHLTSIIMRESDVDWNILVHEMGHIFGLHHLWGQRPGYISGNGCYSGDGAPDTPVPAQGHGVIMPGCRYKPGMKDTLNLREQKIYIENYMGYSHPACMVEFTDDQIEIIRKIAETNWVLRLAMKRNKAMLFKG